MRRHKALALQIEFDRLRLGGVAHECERVAPSRISLCPAICSSRAATFTASPVTSVSPCPATTAPVFTPIRPSRPSWWTDVAQLYPRANRAQSVIRPRDRNPKNGHHGVTDELLHRPPVTLQHPPRCLVVPVHQGPQRLRVRTVTDRRRACQVAEQDRHDLSHLTLTRQRQRSAAARTKPEPVRTLATAPGADDHRTSLFRDSVTISRRRRGPRNRLATATASTCSLAVSTPCQRPLVRRVGGHYPPRHLHSEGASSRPPSAHHFLSRARAMRRCSAGCTRDLQPLTRRQDASFHQRSATTPD